MIDTLLMPLYFLMTAVRVWREPDVADTYTYANWGRLCAFREPGKRGLQWEPPGERASWRMEFPKLVNRCWNLLSFHDE